MNFSTTHPLLKSPLSIQRDGGSNKIQLPPIEEAKTANQNTLNSPGHIQADKTTLSKGDATIVAGLEIEPAPKETTKAPWIHSYEANEGIITGSRGVSSSSASNRRPTESSRPSTTQSKKDSSGSRPLFSSGHHLGSRHPSMTQPKTDSSNSESKAINGAVYGVLQPNLPGETDYVGIPKASMAVFQPEYNFDSRRNVGKRWDSTYRCAQGIAYAVNPHQAPFSVHKLANFSLKNHYATENDRWIKLAHTRHFLRDKGLLGHTTSLTYISVKTNSPPVQKGVVAQVTEYFSKRRPGIEYETASDLAVPIRSHFKRSNLPIVIDDGYHPILIFGITHDNQVIVGDDQQLYLKEANIGRLPIEEVFKSGQYEMLFPKRIPVRRPAAQSNTHTHRGRR
ncbi:hypothetical protein HOH87_00300 [bacterium]|jgi:hypothetical protein|nr:hypothetical protein [bacterium]